ncbi:MAG TPA: MarR family winged helix-turn-helix transcriptional regulator [Terriglobales bacterium]|jgi:DNA-binding MarR family transcriptional regulator|nr:MarR family winged helix-turn-helix transcriptional regulator [Terriglobales bacterium]
MSLRSATLEPNYKIMAELRYQIRRFLHFGELTAREAGLEPQQYQLMLVLKGPADGFRGSIGEIAERLLIQHHSTVELVDRLSRRGMVRRRRGTEDRREVLIELTTRGEKLLRELALRHREELRLAGPEMVGALKKLLRETPGDDAPVRRKTKRSMAKN